MRSDSAFPNMIGTTTSHPYGERHTGLTKRELYAALALHAIASNPTTAATGDGNPFEALARVATGMADALIAELAK